MRPSTILKAIETFYNGYHFRSRIEARWAVFFDDLGIAYEYEKEGYSLEGAKYLPDFWLPRHDCWVEIKGTRDLSECDKASRLAQMAGQWTFVFGGKIDEPEAAYLDSPGGYRTIRTAGSCAYGFEPGWRDWKLAFYLWSECPDCGEVGLAGISEHILPHMHQDCGCKSLPLTDSIRLKAAYATARQARFEHGERE